VEKIRYFNLREGRYKHVDGSRAVSLAPEIGLKRTGLPTIIRSILRRVNQMELEEEYFF